MTARPALALVDTVDAEFGEATALVEFRSEVADRPTLDPEAQVLCALLQATPAIARTVTAHLRSADFYEPSYGELYALIARLAVAGKPHTGPLVLAELEQTGHLAGRLSRVLLDIITAGAHPQDATRLAYAVLAQAYRRGYTRAADHLKQHAEESAAEDLFEAMCALGRDRRDAKARLDAAAEDLL